MKETNDEADKAAKDLTELEDALAIMIGRSKPKYRWLMALVTLAVTVSPDLDSVSNAVNIPGLPSIAIKISVLLGLVSFFESTHLHSKLDAVLVLLRKQLAQSRPDQDGRVISSE